jgi:hypothetical protein
MSYALGSSRKSKRRTFGGRNVLWLFEEVGAVFETPTRSK